MSHIAPRASRDLEAICGSLNWDSGGFLHGKDRFGGIFGGLRGLKQKLPEMEGSGEIVSRPFRRA